MACLPGRRKKEEVDSDVEHSVRVAVVGGGAAGLMAAGYAAELGAKVTLFEKNRSFGKKLLITGKGRCNLTNACDEATFIKNVLRNPRFLYTAIHRFSPADTMAFFEEAGVPLKVERGNRVFPVSDRSGDIVNALKRYVEKGGVRPVFAPVTGLFADGQHWMVATEHRRTAFDAVILATGGKSYPLTGSTGDGYRFAQALGLTVVPPRPSLVPLTSPDRICRDLQGLSLKNVGVTACSREGKKLSEDFGELLFTHFGLSGPTILSLSAYLEKELGKGVQVVIDLKPALDEKTLDKRLLQDFSRYSNRLFAHALDDLLPKKMIAPLIGRSAIAPDKRVNEITKEERGHLVHLLKNFTVEVNGTRPLSEAIVTAGGVAVDQVDPRTMQVRTLPGLYLAGEILDVDAYTGGFNLQIAFATARLAACHAACGDSPADNGRRTVGSQR